MNNKKENLTNAESPLFYHDSTDSSKYGVSISEINNNVSKALSQVGRTTVPLHLNAMFPASALEEAHRIFADLNNNGLMFQYSTSAKRILEQINVELFQSIKEISETSKIVYQNKLKEILSPTLEWLNGIQEAPDYANLKQLQNNAELRLKFQKLDNAIKQILFQANWFPYAVHIAEDGLFEKISQIIQDTSKNETQRRGLIDAVIQEYYSESVIQSIRKSWQDRELDECICLALCQAIEAHLRGEYILTISCLATMWEGLIYIRANNADYTKRKHQKMNKTKDDLKKLTERNNYDTIFADYFENCIVNSCNKVDDVIPGVPNRHAIAHSWYKEYPNKKASLNAILFTDFLLKLDPILPSEGQENG